VNFLLQFWGFVKVVLRFWEVKLSNIEVYVRDCRVTGFARSSQ